MGANLDLSRRLESFSDLLNKTSVSGESREPVELERAMEDLCERFVRLRNSGNSLYLVGNGGSAGVAGHAATDFFNVGRLKTMTLHEPSMLTCMSNDYGYENAYASMLSQFVVPGDIVIAISSSGASLNIRNAAKTATDKKADVITMSGFDADNPLRTLGSYNFWLDSKDYGFVEIGHLFLLHNLSDRLSHIR